MNVKTVFLNDKLEEEIYIEQLKEFIAPIYIKDTPKVYAIVCLYVYVMLIMRSNHDIIISTKKLMKNHFDIKDMHPTDVILGIMIFKTSNEIILSQSYYIEIVLKKFNAYN